MKVTAAASRRRLSGARSASSGDRRAECADAAISGERSWQTLRWVVRFLFLEPKDLFVQKKLFRSKRLLSFKG